MQTPPGFPLDSIGSPRGEQYSLNGGGVLSLFEEMYMNWTKQVNIRQSFVLEH